MDAFCHNRTIGPSVAIIVPTFNHAHYLADALDSALAQTHPVQDIVVVDDGSTDNPAEVIARYPGVRLVRQENRGLAAARNAGLAETNADCVLFLDADDVLHGEAVATSFACMARNPDAGFVYGAHRRVDNGLRPTSGRTLNRVGECPYHDFLRGNPVGMHATVMYDRRKLQECGGFDPDVARCEDYDAYLRMARRHPVGCHSAIVADYRIHDANMSGDAANMLSWVLRIHKRYKPSGDDAHAMRAWRKGMRGWKIYYTRQAWQSRPSQPLRQAWQERATLMRKAPDAFLSAVALKTARTLVPKPLRSRLRRLAGMADAPAPGKVNLGDLARVKPISPNFGFERGTPLDRYYVEEFLAANAQDITGRALEIGDASYCNRFGTDITRQDVLHVSADNPHATIVGDLSQPDLLPVAAFDCMVITQTLHLIYNLPAAVEHMARALRPGGVLLLTVPGVSSVDRNEWGHSWYWSLTGPSAQRLFGETFGPANISVAVRGNVYAATCFLQGLALEEVERDWLDRDDPAYPVIVTVRACRAAER